MESGRKRHNNKRSGLVVGLHFEPAYKTENQKKKINESNLKLFHKVSLVLIY